MSYRENLYTFLTVYRLGSQQKAAVELNLTQPAVSQHIKILEHYIGKKLFYKEGRSQHPTPVGHQLALELRDTFNQLDRVLQNARSNKATLSGMVYVGGITEFFVKVSLPALIPLSNYDIQLRFEEDYVTLQDRLLSGEFDLAQFTTHVVHPNIIVEKLFHQEFILVGHPDYLKQVSRKQLLNNDITSLNNLPWIAYSETLLFINEYFQTIFNQPFTAKVKLLVKDLWAIVEAVRCGIGVTVLPSYFCQEDILDKKIAILFQPQNPPTHDFYLGWKHGALLDPKVNFVKELMLGKSRVSVPDNDR